MEVELMPKPLRIHINYPTQENEEEYENRAAQAMAKILYDTLPPEVVDELISKHKESKH
jgi:hypothetical protein